MAIMSGFFNSKSGTTDRQYTAEDISLLFDGIIVDGVYAFVGDKLLVKPASSGMKVQVGSGRCWFNHVWLYNDSSMELEIQSAHSSYDRYDVVAVDIDKANRKASIVIKTGTASSKPKVPALTNTDTHHQYALANILIPAGSTSISSKNVNNVVGLDTPYVTGPLKSFTITASLDDWFKKFYDWFDNIKIGYDKDNFIKVNISSGNKLVIKSDLLNDDSMVDIYMKADNEWGKAVGYRYTTFSNNTLTVYLGITVSTPTDFYVRIVN